MKDRNRKADAVILLLACIVLVLVYQLSVLEYETRFGKGKGKAAARYTGAAGLHNHVRGEKFFRFKELPVIILKVVEVGSDSEGSASGGSEEASKGSSGVGEGSGSSSEGEAEEVEEEEPMKKDKPTTDAGNAKSTGNTANTGFIGELDLSDVKDTIDFNGNEQPDDAEKGIELDAEVPSGLQHLKNAAVLILAYNRPDTLTKTVDKLFEAAHSREIKIYISIDGTDPSTVEVIDSYKDQGVLRLDHPRKILPPIKKLSEVGAHDSKAPGTMYLAAHYKWALGEVLKKRGHSHAIIVEDDMLVSEDFLSLFEQTAPLLDVDGSLWCVSSWNDNGYKHLDLPDDMLFRTSFFPGLGWMLKKELWDELEPNFPADQWDHWMRSYTTSQGRECVVPFKSRNYNIGSGGANSNPQFFRKYLQNIDVYSGKPIKFTNTANLLLAKYTKYLTAMLSKATFIQDSALQQTEDDDPPPWAAHSKVVAVPYYRERYEKIAKQMGLYPSLRACHRYVNILYYKGVMVLLLDKRLSPYLDEEKRSAPVKGLRAVAAGKPGLSCNDVCEGIEGGWDCARGQFDYVNQCKVLRKVFGGCVNGCRRDWGKDIPVYEHISEEESQFGGHQCLVTEMIPTCEARHPKTERLCPCIPRGKVQVQSTLKITPAARENTNCNDVCSALSPKHRCDDTQFHYVNTCQALKAHFACTSCDVNQGKDIPNYVSKEDDANFGKCLTQRAAPTCDGSHKNTKRLCPCVLNE